VTRRRAAAWAAITATIAALAWVLFVGLPRWYAGSHPSGPATPIAGDPQEPVRKIQVQLFYVSEDGRRLMGAQQDVSFAEDPSEQAKAIINAQLAPAAPPLVSAVPAGTTLRALFLTQEGEAYVDFSGELASAGGSMHELLAIYTIVHALTVNLPTIQSVQLLIDGKEVDTLAGHVSLRRPIAKNLSWVLQ
jgi:spore germination protein GerM